MSLYVRRVVTLLHLVWQLVRSGFLVLALIAVLASVATDLSTSGSRERDPGVRAPGTNNVSDAGFTPQPSNDPSPTAMPPDVLGTMMLRVWNDRTGEWQASSFDALPDTPPHAAVPYLLLIEGATPGHVHRITLEYGDCETDATGGAAYLAGVDASWDVPRTAPSGPARAIPDATIPVPGDPEAGPAGGRFELWGGTFEGSPQGPVQSQLCAGRSAVTLDVRVRMETTFLLWSMGFDDTSGARCFPMIAHSDRLGVRTLPALDCPG